MDLRNYGSHRVHHSHPHPSVNHRAAAPCLLPLQADPKGRPLDDLRFRQGFSSCHLLWIGLLFLLLPALGLAQYDYREIYPYYHQKTGNTPLKLADSVSEWIDGRGCTQDYLKLTRKAFSEYGIELGFSWAKTNSSYGQDGINTVRCIWKGESPLQLYPSAKKKLLHQREFLELEGMVVAYTDMHIDPAAWEIVEFDITYIKDPLFAEGRKGFDDTDLIKAAVYHEVGHAIGLPHVAYEGATMSPNLALPYIDIVSLAAAYSLYAICDRAAMSVDGGLFMPTVKHPKHQTLLAGIIPTGSLWPEGAANIAVSRCQ